MSEPTSEQRERIKSDPTRYVARMFSKMDSEDKEAFNFCIRQAQGGEQHAREEVETWRKAEHATSDMYISLRRLIPGAFITPHAPTTKQVQQVTEAALCRLIDERDAALRLVEEDRAAIRWLLERVAEWTWLTTIQGDGGLLIPPEHVKAIERAGGHVHVA